MRLLFDNTARALERVVKLTYAMGLVLGPLTIRDLFFGPLYRACIVGDVLALLGLLVEMIVVAGRRQDWGLKWWKSNAAYEREEYDTWMAALWMSGVWFVYQAVTFESSVSAWLPGYLG
jgi:hypothetical protein